MGNKLNPLNWPKEAPEYLSPEGWEYEKKMAREAVLAQLSGRSGGEQQYEPKFLWLGYKHVSGTYQAKRYFTDLDLTEAIESDLVEEVVSPFEASGRDEALEYVKEHTN